MDRRDPCCEGLGGPPRTRPRSWCRRAREASGEPQHTQAAGPSRVPWSLCPGPPPAGAPGAGPEPRLAGDQRRAPRDARRARSLAADHRRPPSAGPAREPACSLERDHRPRLRAPGAGRGAARPRGRATAGAFPRGGPGLGEGFSRITRRGSSAGAKAAPGRGGSPPDSGAKGRTVLSGPRRGCARRPAVTARR